MSLGERLAAVDRFQQRRRRLSFVAAVLKKFSDDQAGRLAALIAYYGFLSLFPLLLVLVTVLGFVLQGNATAQQDVLHSALSQFPVIGDQIQRNIHSLHGSGVALAIGLVGAVLAGLGITSVTQDAFSTVWNVPHRHRPDFLKSRLRGLLMLVVLGLLAILSTVASSFVAGGGTFEAVAGAIVALAVNLLLFFAAFRLMTVREVPTRQLLTGVVMGAVLWQIVQHVGSLYVEHIVKRSSQTSGVFAFVLGLLAWLYLGGQITLLSAEVNVVRARRLWPRSLFSDQLLDADRRALAAQAEEEERVPAENVEVDFEPERRQVGA